MNLYFRLFFTFIFARFKKSMAVLDHFISNHFVYPNDLDLFGHMNNGRYFTITDYVRFEMLIRNGLWRAMKKNKLYPVLAGETAQFRKSLQPFQRYIIETKTIAWDEKFVYIEHTYKSKGEVYALILVRVRIIGKKPGIRMRPKDVLKLVTDVGNIPDINMGEAIKHWNLATDIHWRDVCKEKFS